jgi:hypothetical protein
MLEYRLARDSGRLPHEPDLGRSGTEHPEMSRFFHTLVIVGAGISAAACGGQSESHSGGEGAEGGGGSSGKGAGGAPASGGSATSGGTSAGTGGVILAGGTGGTGMTGAFPDPELPTSRWDCSNSYSGCADVLGVTAHELTGDCPVDETLPRSAADCASDELYTCMLAVTATGEPLLTNCNCTDRSDEDCGGCWSLKHYNGEPVSCTPSLKICECAYTGILR